MKKITLKKLTIPLLILSLAAAIFFGFQYYTQKQEIYYQAHQMTQNHLKHLDQFLDYQESLIDEEWTAAQQKEYDTRFEALELHSGGTSIYIDLNDPEMTKDRLAYRDIVIEAYHFQEAATLEERTWHHVNMLKLRGDLQSYFDYLQENHSPPEA
ncbi:hypothetical protein KP77_09410 [Jeotgalibacillus alimentarius]|uniref:Uncharacterized protein n=1 Tax=Jeotgalibacillus alimentarius TaxID=135826 RepID=A0A0C2SBU5_9BACL|nr:hypothetical protein [Jeotgalibacillus alimentarius]KIL51429.1 hypothetical protein KP77_09410 [Jeotgalibacillus alimentarius]